VAVDVRDGVALTEMELVADTDDVAEDEVELEMEGGGVTEAVGVSVAVAELDKPKDREAVAVDVADTLADEVSLEAPSEGDGVADSEPEFDAVAVAEGVNQMMPLMDTVSTTSKPAAEYVAGA